MPLKNLRVLDRCQTQIVDLNLTQSSHNNVGWVEQRETHRVKHISLFKCSKKFYEITHDL